MATLLGSVLGRGRRFRLRRRGRGFGLVACWGWPFWRRDPSLILTGGGLGRRNTSVRRFHPLHRLGDLLRHFHRRGSFFSDPTPRPTFFCWESPAFWFVA